MDAQKRTILIVDDDNLVIQTLTSLLEEHDFDVVAASNGKEGLQALQRSQIDLVLSDINMPVMDGIEMTRQIRANNETFSLPVILLTGRLDDRDTERTQDAGCNMFFVKPFRFPDLVAAIKDLSSKRQRP